jgi:hypothetical protein
LLILPLAAGGCGGRDPREEVADTLARAERALEDGDLRELDRLIAEDYSDDDSRDKRAIEQLAAMTLNAYPTLYLLVRVDRMSFPEENGAEVGLYVAAAAVEIPENARLAAVDADLLRVELSLRDDGGGEWRITSAVWRRVDRSDLL